MEDNCEHYDAGNHDFRFLRQEERNVGYDRNPEYIVEDLFYCCKCLEYKRVKALRRVPKNDGGDYVERLV